MPRKDIKAWLDDFKAFNRKCEREEYTDTEIAWMFMNDAADLFKKIIKPKKKKHARNDRKPKAMA